MSAAFEIGDEVRHRDRGEIGTVVSVGTTTAIVEWFQWSHDRSAVPLDRLVHHEEADLTSSDNEAVEPSRSLAEEREWRSLKAGDWVVHESVGRLGQITDVHESGITAWVSWIDGHSSQVSMRYLRRRPDYDGKTVELLRQRATKLPGHVYVHVGTDGELQITSPATYLHHHTLEGETMTNPFRARLDELRERAQKRVDDATAAEKAAVDEHVAARLAANEIELRIGAWHNGYNAGVSEAEQRHSKVISMDYVESLPRFTVLRLDDGTVLEKLADAWHTIGSTRFYPLEAEDLPATVLYLPAPETTPSKES